MQKTITSLLAGIVTTITISCYANPRVILVNNHTDIPFSLKTKERPISIPAQTKTIITSDELQRICRFDGRLPRDICFNTLIDTKSMLPVASISVDAELGIIDLRKLSNDYKITNNFQEIEIYNK